MSVVYRAIARLGFHHKWFSTGVVTKESAALILKEYKQSDDKNSEHYRYKALKDFVAAHQPLEPDMLRALYHLADHDPDIGMGGTLMETLVRRPECPDDIVEYASRDSERKFLARFATSVQDGRITGLSADPPASTQPVPTSGGGSSASTR